MEKNSRLLQGSIWLGVLVGGVVGLLIGILLGWYVFPVSWTPGPADVAAMADAYDVNTNNLAYAKAQLATLSKDEQSRLFADLINSRLKLNRPIEAKRITTLAQALGVSLTPASGAAPSATVAPTSRPAASTSGTSWLSGIVFPLLLLLVVAVLLVAAGLIFVTKVMPQLRSGQQAPKPKAPPVVKTSTTPKTATSAPAPAPRPAPSLASIPSVPATTKPGGLGRFVASYALGNDNYDTSFSLETPRQEFLGECGMGISETIGDGKPDKVTAFDLWLFDKADVRTVTQILMSEYAYNDQVLRGKLAAKGEAILAEKGRAITLETHSLKITAQIVELTYATTPGLPPNSHFQKLTVEIVPAFKEEPLAVS